MKKDLKTREFRASIPVELTATFEKINATLANQYVIEYARVLRYCDAMTRKHGFDRKAIALNQTCAKNDPARAAVFCVIDQQFDRLHKIIMDSIYPKANQYVEAKE